MEKRLLVVDDNQEIVEIISGELADLFDVLDGANTVEEAEKLLAENVYSVIFLDINLENRNGAEVIKFLIEANNANKNTPFVIISGLITPKFIKQLHNRFAGMLMKPFEPGDIRDIAERLLGLKESPAIQGESNDDIPHLKCEKPFPIVKLEQRVGKILDQVRNTSYLRQSFVQMRLNRQNDNTYRKEVEMIINISTAICMQMDWNTDKTLEKFVFAAYLHDLSITDRSDLARIHSSEALVEMKGKLSPEDYQLVLDHPTLTCKSLESLKEIAPDVQMMIAQHHELPTGNGFPAKMTHSKIPPLSVVFIVAHDLTHYLLNNPNGSIEEYVKNALLNFKGSHFIKIVKSLTAVK